MSVLDRYDGWARMMARGASSSAKMLCTPPITQDPIKVYMKTFKLWFLSCLVVLVGGSQRAVSEPSDKKFVVGLILPLTGELADYGQALRNGFDLQRW